MWKRNTFLLHLRYYFYQSFILYNINYCVKEENNLLWFMIIFLPRYVNFKYLKNCAVILSRMYPKGSSDIRLTKDSLEYRFSNRWLYIVKYNLSWISFFFFLIRKREETIGWFNFFTKLRLIYHVMNWWIMNYHDWVKESRLSCNIWNLLTREFLCGL